MSVYPDIMSFCAIDIGKLLPENVENESVQKIIDVLIRKGVIKFEEYPYNQTKVEKIKRGEKSIDYGKGIAINPDTLWK